jgi:hypothetical protein
MINAIVNAEDLIDAMDLRRSGPYAHVAPRLVDNVDKLILLASVSILRSSRANFAGYTDLWTPQFLIDLANRRP